MSDEFLTQLFYFAMDNAKLCPDPNSRAARQELLKLEHKWVQTMGQRFVARYQAAEFRVNGWQEEAVFLEGLRWGVHLMLAVLPYSSHEHSTP